MRSNHQATELGQTFGTLVSVVTNYILFHSQTGSYAVRSNRQATELGQTFGTLVSVVTNYILQATNAVKAWEGGCERVGSLALKWQKGNSVHHMLEYEILIRGISASSCV